MNPELLRNAWLELTPRRVATMVAVLALVFLAAHFAEGPNGLHAAAEYIFYGVAVVWGARNAAQAVVGEIRDRTWDSQRLSAISPFAMTWGKLLGPTCYAWAGGLACLAVLVWLAFLYGGPARAIADFAYFAGMALMAQSVALFTSLLAVRRRQTHSRFDVFLYQLAGLLAAWAVWWVWQRVAPGETLLARALAIDTVHWWGMALDARAFYLASLTVFFVWAFVGCYRLMRLELQVQNTPVVWGAFVLFMIVYVAGFDGLRSARLGTADADMVAMRLLAAAATASLLSYLAVFAEPKDRVLYRWLGDAITARRFEALASRLQGWMIAYAAAAVLTLSLVLRIAMLPEAFDLSPVNAAMQFLSGFGFLTRDLGVFLIFPMLPGPRRGDYMALVILGVLYAVLPQVVSGLDILFFPQPSLASLAVAVAEAGALWFAIFALGRRVPVSAEALA